MIKIKAVLDKEDPDMVLLYTEYDTTGRQRWLLMSAAHIETFEKFDDETRKSLRDGDEVFMKLEAME